MSRQIQIRRGTAAAHSTFTGAPGELTFDTDTKTLRVHDGTTPGGITLARTDELVVSSPIPDTADYVIETQLPTAANNYTWYRKYASGWVEQGGVLQTASSDANITIQLPVAMKDAFYTCSCSVFFNGTNNVTYRNISCWNFTATSFDIRQDTQIVKHWCVRGVAA